MDTTKPKAFVFVLMPFLEEFKDFYEHGIKAACTEEGVYCERVDEQIFEETILDRIYNQINKADIVIADMTGRNPNVFYETGYAHALDRRVILLTQNSDDIPFDLKHYPHIIYEGKISKLKSEVKKRIHWSINNPRESLSTVDVPIKICINSNDITDKPIIKWGDDKNRTLYLDIQNIGNTVLEPKDYKLALILPPNISPQNEDIMPLVIHKDETGLINLIIKEEIFPQGWATTYIHLKATNAEKKLTKQFELSIRLYTKIGPKDFPFFLNP